MKIIDSFMIGHRNHTVFYLQLDNQRWVHSNPEDGSWRFSLYNPKDHFRSTGWEVKNIPEEIVSAVHDSFVKFALRNNPKLIDGGKRDVL